MERNAEENEEDKTRIYVGGLGEKVTNDDLIKIFSSLGRVTAVDIVRTKGRSIGYVDFFPSSDKSLPKLFSTYNGCVGKGGRLRLEKAKEHYLARLKREWEEDSEPASSTVDADKDMATFEKPKKVLDSDKKLKIFFPRFSKLKALPFSGTGKHKYSFQRIVAPPVPMHFCDCVEHSVPFHTTDGKRSHHHTVEDEIVHDLEAQGGVINEEELNIMNSVMNKLFERENVSNAAHSGSGMDNDGHNSDKLIEDQRIGENELDGVGDEDNLVINVVSRGNNRMAFQQKVTIPSKNKNLSFSETQTSKDRPAQSVPKEQKNNNLPQNKKRKSLHNDESIGNEFMAVNRVETESGTKQSIASHPWSQKLSWKELVGNKDSQVFSVSNILPADPCTNEADNDIKSFDEELEFDENESDEDNLVINVVSKKNKKTAWSRSQEQEKISTMNQESIFNESKASKDRPIQQKNSTPSPKKKMMKSVLDEESDINKLVCTIPETDGSVQTDTTGTGMSSGAQPVEPESDAKQLITDCSWSQKSSLRGLVGDKGNDESSVSNILPENSAKEEQRVSDGPDLPGSTDSKNQNSAWHKNLEGKLAETEAVDLLPEAQPTKTSAAPVKSGGSSSWFQKSSWTQLVNDNNSSFSITQISPAIAFKSPEVSKPHVRMDIANSTDKKFSNLVKQDKYEPDRDGSAVMVDGKEGDASRNILEKNQLTVVGYNEGSASTVENKFDSVQRQTTDGDVTIGETCSFMRNATSMKEWAKAKAAVSGLQSHKRKSNEK